MGCTLDVRTRFMLLYMRVTRPVDWFFFLKLYSTWWKDGIVNSWRFTVNCCNSLNAWRSNEGFGKQHLLAGVRFRLYKFLKWNRPSGKDKVVLWHFAAFETPRTTFRCALLRARDVQGLESGLAVWSYLPIPLRVESVSEWVKKRSSRGNFQ